MRPPRQFPLKALSAALLIAGLSVSFSASAQYKGVAYDVEIGDLVFRIPAQLEFVTPDKLFEQERRDFNARGPEPVRILDHIAFVSNGAWPVTGTHQGRQDWEPTGAKLIIWFDSHASDDDFWCRNGISKFAPGGKTLARSVPDSENDLFWIYGEKGRGRLGSRILRKEARFFGLPVLFFTSAIRDELHGVDIVYYDTVIALSNNVKLQLNLSDEDMAGTSFPKVLNRVEGVVRSWLDAARPQRGLIWRESAAACSQ